MPYRVPFANPKKQYQDHRDEFIKAFDETLSRGAIVNKEELWKFEEDFAKFVGVKYAVGVNSGTSALDVAFQASGVGAGDEVITVAHTFIASISTIHLAGAKPVLIDVGEDFNMDVRLIEKALTPKTKAIEPVHLNGRLCDMEVITDIAKRKGLIVIEDAAQALGAKFNGQSAGSFGLVGCFSLYWAKVLGGWGNNGVAVTNDPEIARKMKLMRYNGEDREDRKFYYHGHNFLMDNVHAALLSVKLKYLPQWLKRRKEIAQKYHSGLENISQVKIPRFEDERFAELRSPGREMNEVQRASHASAFEDIYWNYVLRCENRDELKKHLEEQGVETIISWPIPTYKQPLMMPNEISLPETEKICKEVISLPMYPELTGEQVEYVIKAVKSFYL